MSGSIAAMIANLFSGTSNMLMKKISVAYEDNYFALVLQYIAICLVAIIGGVARSSYTHTTLIPTLQGSQRIILGIISLIGYIGIVLLYKAYDKMHAGIALIIANLSTFIMYFMNTALFPGTEIISLEKMIVAIVFFGVITQFLIPPKKSSSIKKLQNIPITSYLYPLGTAVCWAIYFTGNNYFIKADILHPIQTGMLTESLILMYALIRYVTIKGKHTFDTFIANKGKNLGFFALIGICNMAVIYLTYFGYQITSANTINIIRLLGIPLTTVLCWIFLKDILTKKQTILLSIACGLLLFFVAI